MGAHNLTRNSVLADRVEVADTLWTRFMGLMARPSIDHGFGLWLTGTNGIHMFFMRFAIDAVFLGRPGPDGSREVLATRRGVKPWVGLVPLIRGADGCLELPVGAIDESGTETGDRINIS